MQNFEIFICDFCLFLDFYEEWFLNNTNELANDNQSSKGITVGINNKLEIDEVILFNI